MEQSIPAVSVQAWQQLVELNLRSHQREVTDWLHSTDAEPVLQQLLLHVPCSITAH